jgi:hypothetical protein
MDRGPSAGRRPWYAPAAMPQNTCKSLASSSAPRFLSLLAVFLLLGGLAAPALAKKPKEKEEEKKPVEDKLPSIADKTKGLEARAGFLDLHLDPKSGALLLVLPAPGPDGEILQLLHQTALAGGLGSNPIGLDRGLASDNRVLRLRQVGNKILFEQLNTAFRASSENPAERRAVALSFASSVLWAAEIVAEGRAGETLIDLAPFLLRDYTGIAASLAAAEQGDFQVDADRSAVDIAYTKVFPDNVELEAVLTFAGAKPGPLLPQVAPDPQSLTLIQHHSLVRLPPPGFEPRDYDPRLGAISTCHADFARGLDQTLTRCLAARHRLEKVDPAAERSPVKKPIVFYIDNGAPEPIRTALLEGASWWSQAFDEAGFEGGFKVEILPEDKDPLDARWSVVQWVHRSTRGWSFGGGLADPRTGEILKGHVRLGSQRIRQDRLLIEGLAGTAETGKGGPNDPIEISLARIRQLSAHEVGHAIGLAHNMAASIYGRASVMDYPAPKVTIDAAGKLDFKEAYAVGAGAWDRHAIDHLYRQFPPGADVPAELEKIAARGIERGLLFLGDDDARAAGTTSDPRASLWDNGEDPVAELRHVMKVRAIGLQNFSEQNVLPGAPLAQLREVFAPLYLHHRYQLDAAVKLVGGMEHNYAQRGDGLFATRLVDGARQRQALAAVLELLEPAALDIPESALRLMVPRESLLRPSEEVLASASMPAFDSLGAAATAGGMVVDALLHPARLQRLEESHHRDPGLPGAAEVIGALVDKTFAEGSTTSRRLELQWVTRRVVVERLIQAMSQQGLSTAVQAELAGGLENIRTRLLARETTQARFLASEILRFLERPHLPAPHLPPPKPPIAGAPIGAAGLNAAMTDCSP